MKIEELDAIERFAQETVDSSSYKPSIQEAQLSRITGNVGVTNAKNVLLLIKEIRAINGNH